MQDLHSVLINSVCVDPIHNTSSFCITSFDLITTALCTSFLESASLQLIVVTGHISFHPEMLSRLRTPYSAVVILRNPLSRLGTPLPRICWLSFVCFVTRRHGGACAMRDLP